MMAKPYEIHDYQDCDYSHTQHGSVGSLLRRSLGEKTENAPKSNDNRCEQQQRSQHQDNFAERKKLALN
jgi:hypothetical protein